MIAKSRIYPLRIYASQNEDQAMGVGSQTALHYDSMFSTVEIHARITTVDNCDKDTSVKGIEDMRAVVHRMTVTDCVIILV